MKTKLKNLNLIKCFIMILFLSISGCSSTQSTVYKEGDETWKVNVVKKAALNEEFICTINGTEVLKDSFPLIGDNFQKSGSYKGKKIMMNGYRTSSTSKDVNGNVQSTDTYQIRVFIDDKLIDKFDF
ncbi:MAG TPA: hypothetical protein PKD83_02145 [Ignavibacteria bacterium]|nr:hypothetical protein [Ignavibacteria bacterium]